MELCRFTNSIRMFSSKNDDEGDEKKAPKGFEKFFKKKKEVS